MTHPARPISTSSVLVLGIAQIIAWGGSFFLLSVMADPIAAETGWGRQWIYGALSVGILVSGLLAPLSGKLVARYGGRIQLASSGVVMALGLVIMAFAHSLEVFFLAWLVLGVGMAIGLYETLFATLGGLFGTQASSAISSITLISGLATTVAWPVVAVLVEQLGWRHACLVYAVALVLLIWPMYWKALPAGRGVSAVPKKKEDAGGAPPIDRHLYLLLVTSFTLAAVLMTAVSVQLVSLLNGIGYSLVAAIGVASLLGPSMVAVRIVNVALKSNDPVWGALISALLVAVGLLLLSFHPAWAAAAVVLYGCGNGLRSIVRATLPLVLVSPSAYPVLMGKLARPSLIGQAATPLAGGYLYEKLGANACLWILGGLAVFNVLLVAMVFQRTRQLRGSGMQT